MQIPTRRGAGGCGEAPSLNVAEVLHTRSQWPETSQNPKYVQKQMRLAFVQITFDTYGHLMVEVDQQAAHRLDEVLFGKGLKVAKSA
jgi:hypothetical protein